MENKRESKPQPAAKTPIAVDCKPGEYYWCTCGFSNNQPFCDGTHRETSELSSFRFTVEETKQVHLCMCKQTKNPPYCDGAHTDLD
jgi:CDGSH-type Zn-finger protein